MSATMLKDVLKFSQLTMPKDNLCEASLDNLQKSCGFDDDYLQYHLYCEFCKKLFDMSTEDDNCKTPGCEGSKVVNKNYFVTGSWCIQIREILERKGMWASIEESKSGESESISDIKSGKGYKNLQLPGGFLHRTDNITLSLFIDGIPLYKSSSVSLWPVYLLINEIPAKERFRKKHMVLWGIWQGVGKPNMNMFLRPLVQDLIKFYNDGLSISIATQEKEENTIQVKAMLIVATMDLQARAYVTNMTQHNGEYGCLYCNEPGQMVPSGKAYCRSYPSREESAELRNDGEARKSAIKARETGIRTDGFLGESVLWYLPYFSLTNYIVIDYMHGTLLGITKKFLDYWFATKYSSEPFYIGSSMTSIDRLLREIKPPYMVHRLPRVLSGTYNHWKASELRNWLLFYSLPCLHNFLPNVYLTHFSCLVEATYILLTEGLSNEDITRADMLLKAFVKNVQQLYGNSAMSLNVHNLTHLTNFVRQWGPLWAWSCFPFESFNGEIKQSVHGTGNVCKQIFWALQAQKRVAAKVSEAKSSEVKSFLHAVLDPTENFKSDSEAFQCSIVKKSGESKVSFQPNIKEDLQSQTGTSDECDFTQISKIARNGYQMYSKSCSRVKKQNSYTIALEKPWSLSAGEVGDIIQVDSFVMKKSNRKVFAVGHLMKMCGSIIPRRVPHLQQIEYVGDESIAIPAEHLREPMMIVKCHPSVFAAVMPNNNERD